VLLIVRRTRREQIGILHRRLLTIVRNEAPAKDDRSKNRTPDPKFFCTIWVMLTLDTPPTRSGSKSQRPALQ
jgi:hypothetical protein